MARGDPDRHRQVAAEARRTARGYLITLGTGQLAVDDRQPVPNRHGVARPGDDPVEVVRACLSKYEEVVKDALAHEAYKTQLIPLSTAEKLIKERYEEDELEDILQEFNATLGEKVSESKLVYTGLTNND